jgi:hypothetical protein
MNNFSFSLNFNGLSSKSNSYWAEFSFSHGTNWNNLIPEKRSIVKFLNDISLTCILNDPVDAHEISELYHNNKQIGTIRCDFHLESVYIEFKSKTDHDSICEIISRKNKINTFPISITICN